MISSVGNDFSENVTWPACLSNVIGVAQLDSRGNVASSSIKDNKQHFFISGAISDYKTGIAEFGTSFASPRVAGIYASLKSINQSKCFY